MKKTTVGSLQKAIKGVQKDLAQIQLNSKDSAKAQKAFEELEKNSRILQSIFDKHQKRKKEDFSEYDGIVRLEPEQIGETDLMY